MDVRGAVVVVTGAAGGIGAAMARRFAAEGAAGLVLSDRTPDTLEALAADVRDPDRAGPGAVEVLAVPGDVGVEEDVRAVTAAALDRFGRVDLFCSNAGVATGHGLDATDGDWASAWAVNVLAHVYAARAVVPPMVAQGHGYLLQTCSAAGLLVSAGDAPYSVSKHAAVAFAEWLSLTYADAGIRVSALCPQGVETPMLTDGLAAGNAAARAVAASGPILTPDAVADAVVAGLAAERFLILPHPEVATYLRHRAGDPDRWLAGVRRMVAEATAPDGP